MLLLKCNLNALFDGKVLGGKFSERPENAFYAFSVVQCETAILVKYFSPETAQKVDLCLFRRDQVVGPKWLKLTMDQRVARLINDTAECTVHVYRIDFDGEDVEVVRMITPTTSQTQNESIFRFDPTSLQVSKNKYCSAKRVLTSNSKSPFLDKIPLEEDHPNSPLWNTQREFYGTMHYDKNYETMKVNLCKVLPFLMSMNKEQYKDTSLMAFLTSFGKAMLEGIKYRSDVSFSNKCTSSDFGDAQIEITGAGDCEDMAHMFMRSFRTLIDVYPCAQQLRGSAVCKKLTSFKQSYVPLVMICLIDEGGSLRYHSTILLVRRDNSRRNIRFEVTCPESSVEIDDKEYYKRNPEQYFAVDNLFVARLKNGHVHECNFDHILGSRCCNL